MNNENNIWKIERRKSREMAFDETDILGGKAVILLNDFGIWQFRMWIAEEKKYERKSLKTKDKTDAIHKAEEMVYEIGYKIKEGKKIFGITVEEAVDLFLAEQQKRVGRTDNGIVIGRYNTQKLHLKHFIGYVGGKLKANEVTKTLLQRYTIDGVETDYVSYRKEENISDITIRNELSTIGMCFSWLAENGHTNILKLQLPYTNKNKYDIDNRLIRRQTFTADEYNAFTNAFKSYVAVKKNGLNDNEYIDRQIVKTFLLIQANSGCRSGELRQLKWENVEFVKIKEGNKDVLLAEVHIDKDTSKVRKGRDIRFVGAEYLIKLKELTKRNEGLIFSRDGVTEIHNSYFCKGFRKIMQLADIDRVRKKQLVPYSLRHFFITNEVQRGISFEQIAMHCGTSVKQVSNTYTHVNKVIMTDIAMSRYNVVQKKYNEEAVLV